MGGFGLLWSLIKSLRYLLPFLKEVTDEEGITDDKELAKIRSLKELLSLGIWRFIYIVVIACIVWFGIIPLYSKNAMLQFELEKSNTRIAGLIQEGKVKDNENRKLRDELISRSTDIKNGDIAYKRLLETLNSCREANTEYRHYLISLSEKGTVKSLPPSLQDKLQDNQTKPTSDKTKGLSEEIKRKLESYQEGE